MIKALSTRLSPASAFRMEMLVVCFCIALVASACRPTDPLAEVRALQVQGRFEETIEPLRALLKEHRGDAEIQYLYGRALALTGRFSLSEWSLRAAMDDPEWLLPAGRQLAFGQLSVGNHDNAIETTGRVVEAEPEDLETLMIRARAFAASRSHHEETLAVTDRILELDPNNVEVMKPRIVALIGLERIDEVEEAIEELGRRIDETELGERVPAWHCGTTAVFADESGEIELAEERWNHCLELYPADPGVVGDALKFFGFRNDHARYLEILQKAHEAAPRSRDYRYRLAARLRLAGRATEAESLLLEGTEEEEPSRAAAAWADLAKHHQDLKDYPASCEALEKALDLAGQAGVVNPVLRFEYADTLVLAGDFERAEQVADEMTVAAHRAMIRARIAQEQREFEKSLEFYDEAFSLWPDNPWGRYNSALAAESAGDFDRALESYRYSVRIMPAASDARTRAARLLYKQGSFSEALRVLLTMSDDIPLGLEGELLSLRLFAIVGHPVALETALVEFQARMPDQFGQALANASGGMRERAGARRAIRSLRESPRFDPSDPRQVAALRALIDYSREAGQLDALQGEIESALKANSEVAAFHEASGFWLASKDAPPAEIRAAYARALELDPENAQALAGMGRLLAASAPEQALDYFDRAAAADPTAPTLQLLGAETLIALGRPSDAEERLAALLDDHPYESDAALLLVELHLSRGVASKRTLELANRGVRFGGGADALDLLSRVHQERSEPDLAAQAKARAVTLRSQSKSG